MLHRNKVPITAENRSASSTNPLTWTTYAKAKAARIGDGLGFVLNGDGLTCIDLDHCVENGQPNALAAALIASLPDTYIEISPSGTGLHIWGFSQQQKGTRFDRNGLSVEIYPNGRYITVTGKALNRAAFADLGDLSNIRNGA